MKLVYFTHSLISCWNHGNAHFQRGLLHELQRLGVEPLAAEPADGWSRANLLAEQGAERATGFTRHFPDLGVRLYSGAEEASMLAWDADVVIVHEWTEPAVVAALGAMRRRNARCLLLFHDTHHRAASAPHELERFDLSGYDAVLAFGESIAEIYRRRGWSRSTFVLHEAADTRLFRPPLTDDGRGRSLVWIGNWGDAERSTELVELLLRPAHDADLPLDIYGVRYPPDALAALARHGARYHGWLPNTHVPSALARHLATVHVPRRHYSRDLPGIPTIRVFEALACGIPLVSGPWEDTERLFEPGDFLVASDETAMVCALRSLRDDPGLRRHLAESGLARIRTRHTCAHRAAELLDIIRTLGVVHSNGAA